MQLYKYSVTKINGQLDDKTDLRELLNELNLHGKQGYRLHTVLPQLHEGTIQSTILIFETEKPSEDCIAGG